MNIEVNKISANLEKLMVDFPNFTKLQDEIEQDEVFCGHQTIIFDIENTLVTQLDLRCKQELDHIMESEKFETDYVVIDKSIVKKSRKKKYNQ